MERTSSRYTKNNKEQCKINSKMNEMCNSIIPRCE